MAPRGRGSTQARHPLLRLRIDGDASRQTPRFVPDGVGAMAIETVARRGDEHWLEVAEHELNRRFGDDQPLTRFVWLRGDDVHDILFPQHHVSADAHTMVHQARQLLTDLGRLAAGDPLPPVEVFPLRPPLTDMLPRAAHGLRLFGTMVQFLGSQVATWARGRPKQLVPGLPLVGENRIVHRRIQAARQLVDACRANGVALHSVICAALLRASSEELGGAFARIGCFSALDLRDKLTVELGEEAGLYVSQVTTFHTLGDGRDLCALAREVRIAMDRRIAAGDQYLTIPRMGMFIPSGKNVVERFARRVGGLSAAAAGVTNLGRVSLPPTYGPLTLERMNFSVGVSVVGHLSLAVSTFEDCLTINFIFVEPLIARATATRIADRVIDQLMTLRAPALPPIEATLALPARRSSP